MVRKYALMVENQVLKILCGRAPHSPSGFAVIYSPKFSQIHADGVDECVCDLRVSVARAERGAGVH